VIAASLRAAGLPVVVLARDGRAASAVRKGLTVIDPAGRRRRIRSWQRVGTRLASRDRCSTVFLCVKAPMLHRAVDSVLPGIHPDSTVVSLLNGLEHRRLLRRAFGSRRLVFGSCYFAAARIAPCRVRHWGGDRIDLAAGPENSAAAGSASALLRNAGWKTSIASDELRLLWTKLVYNAAVNPLGALLRRTNGELAGHPASRALMLSTMREAAAVAKAAGSPIPDGNRMERRFLHGCRALPRQFNSMVQDLDAGRPTEVRTILGPVVRHGRRTRTPTPMARSLLRMVLRLEEELR